MSDPRYLRVDEVQAEIQKILDLQVSMRKDMMKQMVGNLYLASIVADECQELMRWKDAISKRGSSLTVR